MLDRAFVLDHLEIVKKAVADKGLTVDVDAFLDSLARMKTVTAELEAVNARRNVLSRTGTRSSSQEARELKERYKELTQKQVVLKEQVGVLELSLPNIPWEQAPVGQDASANRVIKKVGDPPKFSFKAKSHLELGTDLDLIDTVRGVKTSGFRGYYLKNEAALLHLGLIQLAVDRLRKAGFTLMIPPTLVRESALIGSGHFPFGRAEVFQLTTPEHRDDDEYEGQYLAGTSEPALLSYYANATLTDVDLPIRLCGVSPCYRSEIGSYGKDTKGLFRVHEFMKVEQVVFCRPDLPESERLFDEMLGHAETFLGELGLPYRLIETSTGDMGAGKYRMIDIESWMPSRDAYGETHSNSNLTDWQARRLKIKYGGKTPGQGSAFVYTLNNTMIASPRILIALLENNQRADGSVDVPKILRPFVGKKRIELRR